MSSKTKNKKCYVWVKNLSNKKAYAINSQILYYWNGRGDEAQLPFDPEAEFKPGNNYCVYFNGILTRHAAYHVAESRELCQSLTKAVGGKELRHGVVPMRKSLTPTEMSSTVANAKTEINLQKLKPECKPKQKKKKVPKVTPSTSTSPPKTVVSPSKGHAFDMKWLDDLNCSDEDDGKDKPKKKGCPLKLVGYSPVSEDTAFNGDTENGSHLGSGNRKRKSEGEVRQYDKKSIVDSDISSETENTGIPPVSEITASNSSLGVNGDLTLEIKSTNTSAKVAASVTPAKVAASVTPAKVAASLTPTPPVISGNPVESSESGVNQSIKRIGKASEKNQATKTCCCEESTKDLARRLANLEKAVASQTAISQKIFDLLSKMYKTQRKCPLSELERAVEGFEDVEVPDGSVLAGEFDGSLLFIKKDAIAKMEKRKTSLKSRILELGKLFYGVNYYHYSHLGTKDKKKNVLYKIETDHVTSMCKILDCLRWGKPEDLSTVVISRLMGKYFSEVRKKIENDDQEKQLAAFEKAQQGRLSSPESPTQNSHRNPAGKKETEENSNDSGSDNESDIGPEPNQET